EDDETPRISLIDLIRAPKRRDRRVGVPRLPRCGRSVEYQDPLLASIQPDILLARGRERERLRQRRVRAYEVVGHEVVAPQIVPRGRVLLLLTVRHRLREHALRVLEILGLLVRELGGERAPERLHPAIHQLMPRLDVARRGEPDLGLRREGRRTGGIHPPQKADGPLHAHNHSFALATSASASRCATRATSSGGRPNARAAARTSSYSGFTRTPSASGCSSTFTRTDTCGASSTVTCRRASVARSATQRRTPAVVLCRNSAAVTASLSCS